GEDHFALGIGALDRFAAFVLDRNSPAAVKDDAVYLRLDDHVQVGPLHRRAQIGARGAGPPPAAARLLAPADAVAGSRREIIYVLAVLEADLLTRFDYRRAKRRALHLRGKQWAVSAANPGLTALPVLGLLEEWQDLVPAPAAVAQLRPVVVILGL